MNAVCLVPPPVSTTSSPPPQQMLPMLGEEVGSRGDPGKLLIKFPFWPFNASMRYPGMQKGAGGGRASTSWSARGVGDVVELARGWRGLAALAYMPHSYFAVLVERRVVGEAPIFANHHHCDGRYSLPHPLIRFIQTPLLPTSYPTLVAYNGRSPDYLRQYLSSSPQASPSSALPCLLSLPQR